MKKIIFIIMVFVMCSFGAIIFAAEPGNRQGAVIQGPYNPAVTYTGEHNTEALLYKNQRSAVWQRRPRLGLLQQVTCQNALNALKREGRWQGRLKKDGSCGSEAEPQDWITGNRLNYENALDD